MLDVTNWAGNYEYKAAQIHFPKTVEDVRELVSRSSKLKALGTRHSFNDIADTTGDLISLEKLNRIDEPDHERHTVTVEAGVRFGELCEFLHARGCAIFNLASLPHISIAGACATATHGSGDTNGILATAVSAMDVITADGRIETFSRETHGDLFFGAVVALGALGVVIRLTLDVVPAFEVRQEVYENLPLSRLDGHFDGITSSAYSVSFFTDWRSDNINQVWLKRRTMDREPFNLHELGATSATRDLHPIARLSAENCTMQMGVPGPSQERLPHFRMEFTPSAGEELQSEYFIPRPHALGAIRAINQIRDHVAPLLQISEIRTIAADDFWMSPCYQQSCVAVHFTWKKDWPAVKDVLPVIEAQLAPFSPRPHWAKLFTMRPAELRSRYPMLPAFRRLVGSYDRERKFTNAFLDALFVNQPV